MNAADVDEVAADVEGAMANLDNQEGEGHGAKEAAGPSRWHEMSICLMVHPVDGRCALPHTHRSTLLHTYRHTAHPAHGAPS